MEDINLAVLIGAAVGAAITGITAIISGALNSRSDERKVRMNLATQMALEYWRLEHQLRGDAHEGKPPGLKRHVRNFMALLSDGNSPDD